MTVRYTPRAKRDLATILAGIDQESGAGARNVKRALNRAIATIERFPRCGSAAGRGEVRGLVVAPYPYIIYWVAAGEDADILHIRHAARRPWPDQS